MHWQRTCKIFLLFSELLVARIFSLKSTSNNAPYDLVLLPTAPTTVVLSVRQIQFQVCARSQPSQILVNSRYIFDLVELDEQHQLFLRPPRWGKSLFMDMLHCYLDVNAAKDFDKLFQGTDIHKCKADLRDNNKYHVMKFDFSVPVTNTDVMAINKEFDGEIENAVESFSKRYGLSYGTLTTPLGKMKRVINAALLKRTPKSSFSSMSTTALRMSSCSQIPRRTISWWREPMATN